MAPTDAASQQLVAGAAAAGSQQLVAAGQDVIGMFTRSKLFGNAALLIAAGFSGVFSALSLQLRRLSHLRWSSMVPTPSCQPFAVASGSQGRQPLS